MRRGIRGRYSKGVLCALSFFLAVFVLLAGNPARADFTVTVTGPGGSASQTILGDVGGSFDVNIPLNKNAVNTIKVTATDAIGNSASEELKVTQVALDAIVVSKITAQRLSVQEVEQLVNDGIINLADPANYNVSAFDIVLTIADQPVPVRVPVAVPKIAEEKSGWEVYKLPPAGDGGGGDRPKPPPPEIIVFESTIPGPPGEPPISIPGVLVIEGKIKSLKEFFSVRLLLMNTSGIFTLTDITAMIEFPEGGLSTVSPKDGIISFGEILPGEGNQPGQKEKECIIRGDEIGMRDVKVNFGGFVRGPGIPEDKPIPFNGSAMTEVEVKGPPTFKVEVTHPDFVTQGVPYELKVDITNTADIPAMYASLSIALGADGVLVKCSVDGNGNPVCTQIQGEDIRNLGHILPDQKVSQVFTVMPLKSGAISSCMGASDQNISLQVYVGNIGCVVGQFPPDRVSPDGSPAVSVLPTPNANGIHPDSPVTAFFSELMNEASITTGPGGTFNVFDSAGNEVWGQLRLIRLPADPTANQKTVAIWQPTGGTLVGNKKYTVILTTNIMDLEGKRLPSKWESTFTTTGTGLDDMDPPTVSLSIEPPINPGYVLPGQIVKVDAYTADQGSGVARVEARIKDLDEPNAQYQLIDQKTVFAGDKPPFIFPIDSGKLILNHTYQFRATVYDGAGNPREATIAFKIAPTAAAPTVTLPEDPAQPVLHGISVDVTPLNVTGGVREVRFYLDDAPNPFRVVSIAPYQTSLGTLGLTLGTHTVRAVALDPLGQSGEDTLSFTLAENLNMPVVNFGSAVNGAKYALGEQILVKPVISDPVGLASVTYYLDGFPGNPGGNNGEVLYSGFAPILFSTTGRSLGSHTIYVKATNNLGVSNNLSDPESSLQFVITEYKEGPPPAAPTVNIVSYPENGTVTLQGNSVANARISVTNATKGLSINVNAATSGSFTAQIPADAGDTISLVAYDLTTSIYPSAATTVTVQAAPVLTGISGSPQSMSFNARNEYQDITVTGNYNQGPSSNVTSRATFSSSNPAVASVNSSGRVVALSYGTATITATVGGFQAQVSVTVTIVSLTSITVEPSPVNLVTIGQTRQLTVTGHYSNGTTQVLNSGNTFTAGNVGIATVNSSGLISAVGNGNTQITVFHSGVAPVAVPVMVDITQDTAPTVQILSPAPGSSVERGQNIQVTVRAQDTVGGVTRLTLTVTGETSHAELKQISPASPDTTQSFTFAVSSAAAIGGSITLSATAEDTGGKTSPVSSVTLNVVDLNAPVVSITLPANQTPFNYGDTVNVNISATDAVGVTQIRYETTGALTLSGSMAITPASPSAIASFSFVIPFGVTTPNVRILAYARDGYGREGAAIPVDIIITNADITPPATVVTAVADPGLNARTTITYQVTSGLADLDHVELYFRRNGIGTFNRYTDADGGNPQGTFSPEIGNAGSILFDSTKMGGDGTYDFYTVGVDKAGNREPAPVSADQTAVFNAGTVWTTMNSPTTIGEGDTAFDNKNLRITGATVTVNGPHSFKNVELLNGAVLTHSDTTASQEFSLNLSAWTLSIDSTSRIDVAGRGYIGGNGDWESGRTVGNVYGSGSGTGGSYGGLGGRYNDGSAGQPNSVYGSLTDPVDLGSGGGAWGGTDGGDGGGRILINAVNVTVDGSIRANGGESAGSAAGDGSGGGIRISTKTLSGAGNITANGGGSGNGTGGGGGRIAITFFDMETMNAGGITAMGGLGQYGSGANGTVFLKQEQTAGGELVITGQGPATPWTNLTIPTGYTFDSITLRDNARVITNDPITVTGALWVTGNSILTHSGPNEAGLVINASVVQVDAGSAIDVTGRGYAGGAGDWESGRTLGNAYGSGPGTGGSYGGLGGRYSDGSAGQANLVYGNVKDPVFLGSGGGSWGGYDGGSGGGRITIHATEEVIVHGAIRSNGGESAGSAAGDGSGGSIRIETSRLAGTGSISANGGGSGNGVGGGGGRVAIYCDYVDPTDDLGDLRGTTAFGGRGNYDSRRASAGTVYIKYSNQQQGDLYIDDNVVDGSGTPNGTSPESTPLTYITFGTTAGVNTDAFTLTTDGLASLMPGGLVGMRINPDITQQETFVIQSNTANVITVINPNEHGINFSAVAGAGKTYGGWYRFDNVFFRRGGNLVVGDIIEAGTMRIEEYGVLTHFETTPSFVSQLDLTVGDLVIDTTGRIDVTGRGYIGGKGDWERGRTVGNVYGSGSGTGGSYGGLGGRYNDGSAGQPNDLYGSLTDPVDLGSGGGAWGGTDGGDGGGRIFITATHITLNGRIMANGGESEGSAAGDGSGGTVSIVTGSLAGGGIIQANGGGNGNGTGGGGGRIAIYHNGSLTVPAANITAIGDAGHYGVGGNGTVYFRGPGQQYGDLIVDGLGNATPTDTTTIPGDYTFNDIVLRNSARVVADDGITVTGRLLITGNSILTHSGPNETGLVINASVVQVDAGSAIDVTGRGYAGGAGDWESGRTLGNAYGSGPGTGGSYGGLGGRYSDGSAGQANLVYGNVKDPMFLGSGGGSWGGYDGGSGGGRITIHATEEVIVHGAIRSNGGESAGSAAGDGSGGSIRIETSRLAGTGSISANGGGSGNGVGGGGGRVAIYCDYVDPTDDLGDLRGTTAFGGRGNYDSRRASAGTVYIKYSNQQQGDLYIDDNVVDGSGTPNGTSPESTPLTYITFGTTAGVNTDAFTLTTDGLASLMPGGLVGMRINPDITQQETFVIQSNTANAITVINPNEHGINFSAVAGAGKTYGGWYRFDNVFFRRGGNLVVGDIIEAGTMRIEEYGVLTHFETTPSFVSQLDLTVGDLVIDTTGRIDVTGRGYIGGKGDWERGRTVGNVYGSGSGTGGSYGGLGGRYNDGSAGQPNDLYGSLTDPVDLGSGGGAWGGTDGGDGGGRIFITATHITLNGRIMANGGESEGSAAGDGSGGTVSIVTGSLAGGGIIQANGGGNGNGTGGGGGRIAIDYNTSSFSGAITANGGDGSYGDGGPGTVNQQ